MFAIAGVSGNTGRVVADNLLQQGHAVRVIVRDAAKGKPWAARGAEVAVAELGESEALTVALKGVRAAYLLVPPQYGSTDMLRDQAQVVESIASAVKASKLPHVVLLSSVGAQHESGTGPIRTVHVAERALAATGTALTSLRASYFMENWATSLGELAQGKLGTFLKPDLAIAMVATHDIGVAAAHALVDGPRGQDLVALAGPREYSANDVAAALTQLTGKKVEAAFGPDEVVLPALTASGLPANVAELFRELYRGVNNGRIVQEKGKVRELRGPTSIEQVLTTLLKQAAL